MTPAPKSLCVGFLFDDTLDSNDGVAQYVKTIGAWLSEAGHEVHYLVGETKLKSWSGGQVHSLAKNQRVVFNGNRLSIPLPAKKSDIQQLLNHKHFDVLHVQVPYSPLMAQKVINSAPADTAVVGTFHILPSGVVSKAGSLGLRRLYGRSMKRFDARLSVSRPAAQFALKYYGWRSRLLPNVINNRLFSDTGEVNHPGSIVFLGRLVPRKGVPQLLKAFKLLLGQMPDARLVIAGDGPQRQQLEKFVSKNKLTDRVRFLGYVDEKHKAKLLAGAALACFPSLGGESFGIVLLEAMAAGAGVVLAGDNPGYASVLGDRPELLIDPRDSRAFARRLESLLNDQARIDALHAWQTDEVKLYDVANVGPQLLDIYRRAIAKRRQSRHN